MAGESRRQRIRAITSLAGCTPIDTAPFEAAFVHESAAKEHLAEHSNERLEFLGDAVLGFIVARSLYNRYPDASEGELALRKSSLVSDAALAATAERLGFDAIMLLGAGLAAMPAVRRRSALADAFEAFLAVLHRECGMETTAAFVAREHIAQHERSGVAIDDPKTVLQEWTQRRFGVVPTYVDSFDGPAHERTFSSALTVDGDIAVVGSGPSKKTAQRAAAALALAALGERYDDVAPRALSLAASATAPRPVACPPPRARKKVAAKTARPSATKRTHS